MTCLSPAEQGFQYVFIGLVGVRVLFDLGIGSAVVQFVAHEGSRFAVGRTPTGDPEALARVASILRTTTRVYAILTVLFLVLVLPIGAAILGGQNPDGVDWEVPWMLVVAGTALSIPQTLLVNFLFGCGQIAEIARLRVVTGVIQTLVYAGMLVGDGGLYAAPVGVLAGWLVQAVVVWVKYGHFLIALWKVDSGDRGISWMSEVWPFQWRIALSWGSSYFLAQAIVPLAFAAYGPVAAGRLGLTLGLAATIQGIAWSWLGAKFPTFASLVGASQFNELDRVFRRAVVGSLVFFGAAAGALFTGVAGAGAFDYAIADRFLPPVGLALLLAAGLGWHLTECLAGYLQAFKRDPLVWVKLPAAVAIAGLSWAAADRTDVVGMAAIQAGVSFGIGVGGGVVIFRRCRAAWTIPPAGAAA